MPAASLFKQKLREGQIARIWTSQGWHYYLCLYAQAMPQSSQSMIDFGAINTGAAAAKAVQSVVQLNKSELIQYRMECIDDIEIQLYEIGQIPMWNTKNVQARVTIFTPYHDPDLESTEFWVLGQDRDVQFTANNAQAVNIAAGHARAAFWGWRYILGAELTGADLLAKLAGAAAAVDASGKPLAGAALTAATEAALASRENRKKIVTIYAESRVA